MIQCKYGMMSFLCIGIMATRLGHWIPQIFDLASKEASGKCEEEVREGVSTNEWRRDELTYCHGKTF